MHIRSFERSDAGAVADLFCRIFRSQGGANPAAVAAHLCDVYLETPWRDPDDPSLVCETDAGIGGFLGVLPFPMSLGGRPIRAAIGGNFMIDPAVANPFAGAQLIKRFFDGPHDVSMTDTSNEAGRKTWESRGGHTLPLYSLQWLRVLRPAAFALSVASRAKAARPAAWLGRPFARLADALVARPARSPFRFEPGTLETRDLAPDDILAGIQGLSKVQTLVPRYDPESLAWLIDRAARKREFGDRLVGKALFLRGALAGWYLYYPNPGRWGQVLQVMARPAQVRSVLEHLFAEAFREGSTALVGRAHPLLMNDLPGLKCVFLNRGTWVQVHTQDAEILNAAGRGEAFLTRLEGEWWTRFQNDAFDDPAEWPPPAQEKTPGDRRGFEALESASAASCGVSSPGASARE